MPNLPVDMSGGSPDFTINFNTIPDNSIEYLTNSVGTNNGYFRSSDGLCGEWLKSDHRVNIHLDYTNGTSTKPKPCKPIINCSSHIQYAGDPTKALLTYNIISAPAGAFPVTVEVYTDMVLQDNGI